jgi:hypothetical protein
MEKCTNTSESENEEGVGNGRREKLWTDTYRRLGECMNYDSSFQLSFQVDNFNNGSQTLNSIEWRWGHEKEKWEDSYTDGL